MIPVDIDIKNGFLRYLHGKDILFFCNVIPNFHAANCVGIKKSAITIKKRLFIDPIAYLNLKEKILNDLAKDFWSDTCSIHAKFSIPVDIIEDIDIREDILYVRYLRGHDISIKCMDQIITEYGLNIFLNHRWSSYELENLDFDVTIEDYQGKSEILLMLNDKQKRSVKNHFLIKQDIDEVIDIFKDIEPISVRTYICKEKENWELETKAGQIDMRKVRAEISRYIVIDTVSGDDIKDIKGDINRDIEFNMPYKISRKISPLISNIPSLAPKSDEISEASMDKIKQLIQSKVDMKFNHLTEELTFLRSENSSLKQSLGLLQAELYELKTFNDQKTKRYLDDICGDIINDIKKDNLNVHAKYDKHCESLNELRNDITKKIETVTHIGSLHNMMAKKIGNAIGTTVPVFIDSLLSPLDELRQEFNSNISNLNHKIDTLPETSEILAALNKRLTALESKIVDSNTVKSNPGNAVDQRLVENIRKSKYCECKGIKVSLGENTIESLIYSISHVNKTKTHFAFKSTGVGSDDPLVERTHFLLSSKFKLTLKDLIMGFEIKFATADEVNVHILKF